MAFDPDKYLASRIPINSNQSSGDFDPDAYLQSKTNIANKERANLSPLNRAYDVAEQGLEAGAGAISPILSAVGKVSQAGSDVAKKVLESTTAGKGLRYAQSAIGSMIPESIKQARLSQMIPGAYNESGAGIQLQRGGMLDPTLGGAYQGAESMALDPLNLVAGTGGFSKAAGVAAKQTVKAAASTGAKVAEGMTGVPSRVIKNYKKFAPQIEDMKANPEILAADVHSTVKNTLDDYIRNTGEQLGDSIERAGGSINLVKVKAPFDEAMAKAQLNYAKNPTAVNEAKISSLKAIVDDYFTTTPGWQKLNASGGFELQQDLKQLADFKDKITLESKYRGLTQNERAVKKAAEKAYAELNNQFNTLTEGVSGKLKKEYADLMKIRKTLEPIVGDPQKTYKSLRTLNNKSKKVIRSEITNIDKKLGTNIGENVDLMETYSFLGEPSITPLSGGTTSTTRSIIAALLGGATGGTPGALVGAALTSPYVLKQGLNAGIGAQNLAGAASRQLGRIPTPNLNLSPLQQIAIYQGLAGSGNTGQ